MRAHTQRSPGTASVLHAELLEQRDQLSAGRTREVMGPRLGAKVESKGGASNSQRLPSEAESNPITDTQRVLVRKMEELVGQHHYRSSSGIQSHLLSEHSAKTLGGTLPAGALHSRKTSLTFESARHAPILTPTHAATASSSIRTSAAKPRHYHSAQMSIHATPKKQPLSEKLMSAGTASTERKQMEREEQERSGFYSRLFKRLEEESPGHPSTIYSPSHLASPKTKSTAKKSDRLFKSRNESESTAKKPKIEETCNFGEFSPCYDLNAQNSSFNESSLLEGNISIQSFLRESPEHRPQPQISAYQPPAMELKARPLNNDSDSSPEPVAIKKPYARRGMKSSLGGESAGGGGCKAKRGPKGGSKKTRSMYKSQTMKSQEFSFTHDPSRNTVLHTLSSNDSGRRLGTKDSLDLSMSSTKYNYSSNNLDDFSEMHQSFTSRPGTARQNHNFQSMRYPVDAPPRTGRVSPALSAAQKENKTGAPKWKYSYKSEKSGSNKSVTTAAGTATATRKQSERPSSRCLTPRCSSRASLVTRKSDTQLAPMLKIAKSANSKKNSKDYSSRGSEGATKFFLDGCGDAPKSCRNRGLNNTLSFATTHVGGSSRNSRTPSCAKEETKRKHNYQASPKVKKDPKELHFAVFQTEANVKYGSIPLEQKLLSNPEKAFKTFISSLKQEILDGAKEEEQILQGATRKSTESLLERQSDGGVRGSQEQPRSISESLLQMLNKEKYVKLGSKLGLEGLRESGRLLDTPRHEKEEQLEEFEIMECLTKRSDYEILRDIQEQQEGKEKGEETVSTKHMIAPLSIPKAESCSLTKQVQGLALGDRKFGKYCHHPSRSQNYSFGGGYEAADEQSTARRNIEDPQATPRLSTEEETEEERSSKT